MMLLVKSVFVAFARKRVFPAIVFSAVWSFHSGSGFIGLVSKLGCLASQQVAHMSKSYYQIGFVGCGFLGCGVLPASVS